MVLLPLVVNFSDATPSLRIVFFRILIIFSFILFVFWSKQNGLRIGLGALLLLAYVGVLAGTSAIGLAPQNSFFDITFRRYASVIDIGFFAVFALMVSNAFGSVEWSKFFTMSILVGVIVALFGMIAYYNFGHAELEVRLASTLANPINFAAFMVTISAFVLAKLEDDRSPLEYALFGLCLFLFLISIWLSATRGAILAVAVVSMVWAFRYYRIRLPRKPMIIFCASVLACTGLALVFMGEYNSIERFGNAVPDGSSANVSANIRAAGIIYGFKSLSENPLGVGTRNFWALGVANLDDAHNFLAESAATAGYPGLILWILISVSGFWLLRKDRMLPAWAGIQVLSMFMLGFPSFWFQIAILIGYASRQGGFTLWTNKNS